MSTERSGPIAPGQGPGTLIEVTPESAGWDNVAFAVIDVRADHPHRNAVDGRETAIVTLSGAGRVLVDGQVVDVARSSVFDEVGRVVYVPPGVEYVVECDESLTGAVGSTPASSPSPTTTASSAWSCIRSSLDRRHSRRLPRTRRRNSPRCGTPSSATPNASAPATTTAMPSGRTRRMRLGPWLPWWDT